MALDRDILKSITDILNAITFSRVLSSFSHLPLQSCSPVSCRWRLPVKPRTRVGQTCTARRSMGAQASAPQHAGLPPAAADAQTSSSGSYSSSSNDSSCPVPESLRSSPIYNVYNERIDQPDKPAACALNPRNNIAFGGNQPFPGQKVLLSTERVQSTIPKGGTEGTWQYPSPQMFYNGTLKLFTSVCSC